MAKIEIEIPEEVSFLEEKIAKREWAFLATRLLQELQERIAKVVRYNEIISRSKATEEDVEELSNEIKEAVWKHHSKH